MSVAGILKMNRKSNIPVTLLVVGTIAVVIIALIIFNNERNKLDSGINYFRNIEVLNNVQNDLSFYKDSTVLNEIYPSKSLIFGVSIYHAIFKNVRFDGVNGFMTIEAKETDWLGREKANGKTLLEIKVPINPTN